MGYHRFVPAHHDTLIDDEPQPQAIGT